MGIGIKYYTNRKNVFPLEKYFQQKTRLIKKSGLLLMNIKKLIISFRSLDLLNHRQIS